LENIYKELEYTMAKNRYAAYIHPPYALECKLVQSITHMDIDKSTEILKEINSLERAQLSKEPLISLRYSIIGSCTLFTRAVINAGLDAETAFILSDYYINLIGESSTNNKLETLEYTMLKDFIKVLKRNKEFSYNKLINSIIGYIKKNIESNLSLHEISSFANVHPNYLSAAFKKEVGKTLSEYINALKISSIKIYLDNTDLSISEISYTFNFNHISYFSRFFKKHTGLTPKDYRNKNFPTESAI